MSKRSAIPLHVLSQEKNQGIFIHRIDNLEMTDSMTMESHRDDHCNFFFHETGYTRVMVDFREVVLEGSCVFCILPGQVHQPLFSAGSSGWFLATGMTAMDENYRVVFEEYVTNGEPVILNEKQVSHLRKCLQLLFDISISQDYTLFNQSVMRSMMQVCLGGFAGVFQEHVRLDPSVNLRPAAITREFKRALLKNCKTIKSPSGYAAILNISLSYLNEVVKETTGKSVGNWIHEEIIMEAKRLLYYTDMGIKQIAFSLGYEDHAYFSRLFTKNNSCSPGAFRKKYRE